MVIKKIYIKPFQKISLQKHAHRDEFWYILSGIGGVQIGNEHRLAHQGETLVWVEVKFIELLHMLMVLLS